MDAVTVDTNIFPIADIKDLVTRAGYSLEVISVTNRELEGTDLSEAAGELTETLETFHFGEGSWGRMVWGSVTDAEDFEKILQVISSGGYPKDRENVTQKQINQRRDALILQAHIRSSKKIFVSNDERGFVKHGRRETLEAMFGVTIFTRLEFIEHCKAKCAMQ
ncbi:hypothetical protein [Pseudomonas chlororaphis]|uniref:hypothetical protein n=1 Tax=Pseudomonas chlororaphis TaxID=587753 RepID=UPI0039DFED11